MSKYSWFFITTLYLLLVTLIISQTADVSDYAIGSGVPDALETMEDGTSLQAIWAFIKIYFQILTFQITGFPPILSLLMFHSVALTNGVLLIELLPFT